MTTAAERRHMGRVAALCCVLCRHLRLADDTPAEVHHLRAGQGKKRAAHADTMPLCVPHHRGSVGIHHLGTRLFERTYGITELDLLAITRRELGEVQ